MEGKGKSHGKLTQYKVFFEGRGTQVKDVKAAPLHL